MRAVIKNGTARGRITAPPSKSIAHRLLICAAMAEGESVIRGVSDCDDVEATSDCLRAMGVPVIREGDTVKVRGIDFRTASPSAPLCCRESGSTLRFLVPVCLACGKNVMLTAAQSLLRRPMSVYSALAAEKGYMYSQDETSVMVRGPLQSGEYRVPGNISSQFVSGLLFALPLNPHDSTIVLVPPVESRPYIDLTIDALAKAGVKAEWRDDRTLFVPGSQRYKPFDAQVEGDYSGAAFFMALSALGGSVGIDGLNRDSIQGDRVCEEYISLLRKGSPALYIGDCPDLGPLLFAVAAAGHGGVFTGTSRLRLKESDRAEAMAEELRCFGTAVTVRDDSVVVYPASFRAPQEPLHGHGDHRIVMALAVLLTITGGSILGAEAVSKSFPDFFKKLSDLGIGVELYDD